MITGNPPKRPKLRVRDVAIACRDFGSSYLQFLTLVYRDLSEANRDKAASTLENNLRNLTPPCDARPSDSEQGMPL